MLYFCFHDTPHAQPYAQMIGVDNCHATCTCSGLAFNNFTWQWFRLAAEGTACKNNTGACTTVALSDSSHDACRQRPEHGVTSLFSVIQYYVTTAPQAQRCRVVCHFSPQSCPLFRDARAGCPRSPNEIVRVQINMIEPHAYVLVQLDGFNVSKKKDGFKLVSLNHWAISKTFHGFQRSATSDHRSDRCRRWERILNCMGSTSWF
jgi:hypothetical protein